MAAGSELDTMKAVEDALAKMQDTAARDRVLQWAWAKYFSKSVSPLGSPNKKTPTPRLNRRPKGTPKKKTSPSFVKELNLNPKGKKSFKAFIGEKRPKGHPEQCTTAAYYIQHVLAINEVTPNHIYTCYREAKWRLPSDLIVCLRVIATRNGWIDTGDLENIKVTARGVNLVEQDLPKEEKKK